MIDKSIAWFAGCFLYLTGCFQKNIKVSLEILVITKWFLGYKEDQNGRKEFYGGYNIASCSDNTTSWDSNSS